jgi:hypothetical protein
VLVAWSVPAILLTHHRIDASASPSAAAAADLAQVRVDADNVRIDDQLTLSDNGEDCSFRTKLPSTPKKPTDDPYATAYVASCTYETAAEAELAGKLTQDLDAIGGTSSAREFRRNVGKAVAAWHSGEQGLPTLQNLDTVVEGVLAAGQSPHLDAQFLTGILDPYTKPPSSDSQKAADWFKNVLDPVVPSMEAKWTAYDHAEPRAASPLSALAPGAVLLGLLGAAGAVAGTGARVSEYWSRGPRNAPRYASAPLVRHGNEG